MRSSSVQSIPLKLGFPASNLQTLWGKSFIAWGCTKLLLTAIIVAVSK
jgi:hypothetical protein